MSPDRRRLVEERNRLRAEEHRLYRILLEAEAREGNAPEEEAAWELAVDDTNAVQHQLEDDGDGMHPDRLRLVTNYDQGRHDLQRARGTDEEDHWRGCARADLAALEAYDAAHPEEAE